MLLSHKTKIRLTDNEANIIGHMCYAASKLWNVCNYERHHYQGLKLPVEYPDWYYQKKAHKDDRWYKSLPSQTAQEVCKLLDKSWKSFYALKKSGGIENPKPPYFKKESIAITYMQMGIMHSSLSEKVRLSLPKQLMEHMKEEYGISERFLYLENIIFRTMDNIKQIRIYPPENNEANIIVIYEVSDTKLKEDNGHYLSIDPGLHNLFTCVDSVNGNTFIAGRKYLSITYYFDKEIGRVQSQWYSIQKTDHPKGSKHIQHLYEKKQNSVRDYLHKVTRSIVSYCVENDISVVVIGDIKGIRENNDHGRINNRKLHGWPYEQIYTMLEYKLKAKGIKLIKQQESYSSQVSPLSPKVSKAYAKKTKRVNRGLYKDGEHQWNADVVGAYNILRKNKETTVEMISPLMLKEPYVLKVAV